MRGKLTEHQEKILTYIVRYTLENGYQPTMREIGTVYSIRSVNAVSDILKALQRKGWIKLNNATARSLIISPAAWVLYDDGHGRLLTNRERLTKE